MPLRLCCNLPCNLAIVPRGFAWPHRAKQQRPEMTQRLKAQRRQAYGSQTGCMASLGPKSMINQGKHNNRNITCYTQCLRSCQIRLSVGSRVGYELAWRSASIDIHFSDSSVGQISSYILQRPYLEGSDRRYRAEPLVCCSLRQDNC